MWIVHKVLHIHSKPKFSLTILNKSTIVRTRISLILNYNDLGTNPYASVPNKDEVKRKTTKQKYNPVDRSKQRAKHARRKQSITSQSKSLGN